MQDDYRKFKKEILDAVKSYRVALDELDQYYDWRNELQLEKKRREKKAAKLKKWEEVMAKKRAEKEKKKKRGRRIC